MSLTGVVLAGGDAQRFGSDKLLYEVEGRPILARVVRAMTSVADRVVVSVRDGAAVRRLEGAVPPGVVWLEDRAELGGAGPAAGMLTALDRWVGDDVVFAPGDMPWLTAEALQELGARARHAGVTAAAPLWPDGWTEPLLQWHRAGSWADRLSTLPRRDGQGSRPTDLLRGAPEALLLPAASLAADPRCFTNVNSPADLTAAPRPSRTGGAPVARGPDAVKAFWAAVGFSARGATAEACRAFQGEARIHGRTGLAHLELHALQDAIRCARGGGFPAGALEDRVTTLRRTMPP